MRSGTEARNAASGIGFDGGSEDNMRHCLAGCYLRRGQFLVLTPILPAPNRMSVVLDVAGIYPVR